MVPAQGVAGKGECERGELGGKSKCKCKCK